MHARGRASCCCSATTASTPTTAPGSAPARSCRRSRAGTASSDASRRRTATPTRTATASPTSRSAGCRRARRAGRGARGEGRAAAGAARGGARPAALRVDNTGKDGFDFGAEARAGGEAAARDQRRLRRSQPGHRAGARGALRRARGGRGLPPLLRPRRAADLGRRGAADDRGRSLAAGHGDRRADLDLPDGVLPVPVRPLGQRGADAVALGRRARGVRALRDHGGVAAGRCCTSGSTRSSRRAARRSARRSSARRRGRSPRTRAPSRWSRAGTCSAIPRSSSRSRAELVDSSHVVHRTARRRRVGSNSTEPGVGSVAIVVREPSGQGRRSSARGGVRDGVGPLPHQGLDELLGSPFVRGV